MSYDVNISKTNLSNPERPFKEGENISIVDSYDVTEKASVKILHDDITNSLFYKVIEPSIKEKNKELLSSTKEYVYNSLISGEIITDDDNKVKQIARDKSEKRIVEQPQIRRKIQNTVANYVAYFSSNLAENLRIELSDEQQEAIIYYTVRDLTGYARLEPILRDDKVEDIYGNAPEKPVEVYHSEYSTEEYNNLTTNVAFTEDEMRVNVSQFAEESGKSISSANPAVGGALDDGSRVQLNLSRDINPQGPNFVIRRYNEPETPAQLLRWQTFDEDMLAFLWLAVENGMNIMFCGGTGAGKTTSMNACNMFIQPKKEVISIEDTREVEIPHQSWVPMVTRETNSSNVNNIGMGELVKNSLRMRPEYIIVGEVRGEEAVQLFQAINTGHATTSTFHSENMSSTINRLQELGVSSEAFTGIDAVVFQGQVDVDNSTERRVVGIHEVIKTDTKENEKVIVDEKLFGYESESDSFNRLFTGRDSNILDKIALRKGWTETELTDELERRKNVLTELSQLTVDYDEVTQVLREYMKNKERVETALNNNSLGDIYD